MIKKSTSITYYKAGDNYDRKDPVKKIAQAAAVSTSKSLIKNGFSEVSQTRGESAYVWKQGKIFMASVIEGLGVKNLVADEMYKKTGKTFYDVIAHDTIATIINDLVTVGAKPLALNAYWAIPNNKWLKDKKRINDLISGWKDACNIAGVTWGGGETPTLNGILKDTVDLGGSAVGIISSKDRLLTDSNLKEGDRIILIKSSGVNTNGISLIRAIAKTLPKGYLTRLRNGKTFGEEVLTRSNIYAKLIQDLLDSKIKLHYIANITGHGLRKIMRARHNFTYVIEKIIKPQEIFNFIQEKANLSNYEMYKTFNMGMDYALFIDKSNVKRTQEIIRKNGFISIDAGFVQKRERKVIIKPKNIIYKGDTLDLR